MTDGTDMVINHYERAPGSGDDLRRASRRSATHGDGVCNNAVFVSVRCDDLRPRLDVQKCSAIKPLARPSSRAEVVVVRAR